MKIINLLSKFYKFHDYYYKLKVYEIKSPCFQSLNSKLNLIKLKAQK